MPRFAGIPTFMRLPNITKGHALYDQMDIAIVGVPWDAGTSNRPGARHGPRQLRDLSTMIRAQHPVSKTRPFEIANCADVGDIAINPSDLLGSMDNITEAFKALHADDVLTLAAGGDHLTSLPILRALASKEDPLGMIHFDAHTDLYDGYFGGTPYNHGTPFRRALEEGLLDGSRVVQIGLRGTRYDMDDITFGQKHGVTMIMVEELMETGPEAVMNKARAIAGTGRTYVSFDIDFLDPAYAPGTGTPEIGGPNSFTAQQLVRGLDGVNVVGADLVEVSPPFDPSGNTAWVGASLMFELLCVMAGQVSGANTS
ncbi:MAG: agmatinase [Pseudomonadota bacterium]